MRGIRRHSTTREDHALEQAIDIPSLSEVEGILRRALHHRDPFERAAAAAKLTVWRLPITPSAMIIAAERLLETVRSQPA